MNLKELSNELAAEAGISKTKALKVVHKLAGIIRGELGAGGCVRIEGFGSFRTGERKATRARNPRTGQMMDVPLARTPKFIPSMSLRKHVR